MSSHISIKRDHPLKTLNTFGLDAKCSYFVEPQNVFQLNQVFSSPEIFGKPVFVLGGGSNVLFTANYKGLIIHPVFKGIKILFENEQFVDVEVMAGENWDAFVNYCLNRNYAGFENLVLIPGNVGAAPIQNIGAYGVEQKDHFKSLTAFDMKERKLLEFNKQECDFEYRNSRFKKEKGRYLIVSVIYSLKKNARPDTGYAALHQHFKKHHVSPDSIQKVADAVRFIRRSKLPDPDQLGNAGSFFKNPVVNLDVFEKIRSKNDQMPYYLLSGDQVKIPAGWLIEKCGWKGKRIGNAGVHEKQALVIVNYGGVRGGEILELSIKIRESVKQTFGIELEAEVNIL
ncbi:MAG: UDP-N-acetylmuramate dehydrogenase [Bacteroidales bacterium]|nr:UDP-N-acetylmuramate dehydrogenase [Bacteroidales bacterium]MCF8343551.1 UDP-N-acetylmuramate dehydrogenase [Bacteroidales bacterium]MCF8351394.1 UDP-N-acetylmuramate dehydrogenase [Bacteroidales bacterium]MCF8375602.1 UDP-N-acetylmuramate dehydrogenase [Bacteroidales bacterium]